MGDTAAKSVGTEPNFEALAASAFETIGVGGIPIRCLRTGSGQPLLLIHTLRTQSDYFARIVPKLRQHFEVHLLDLPGHGHSAAPTVAYTADFFLHVVREFVATRKLKDFVVAGESIGATLALALGAESSSVTRVVALNPFDYRGFGWIARRSWMTWLGFFGLRTPGIGRVVSSLTPRALLRKVLQGGFRDPRRLPESLVDELHAAGNRSGHSRAFYSLCRSWNSWASLRSRVRNLRVPLTLVQGDFDWATKAVQEADAHELSPKRLVRLENCGHFSSLERPNEVVQSIVEE